MPNKITDTFTSLHAWVELISLQIFGFLGKKAIFAVFGGKKCTNIVGTRISDLSIQTMVSTHNNKNIWGNVRNLCCHKMTIFLPGKITSVKNLVKQQNKHNETTSTQHEVTRNKPTVSLQKEEILESFQLPIVKNNYKVLKRLASWSPMSHLFYFKVPLLTKSQQTNKQTNKQTKTTTKSIPLNLNTSNFNHEHGCSKNMTSMIAPKLDSIDFFLLWENGVILN